MAIHVDSKYIKYCERTSGEMGGGREEVRGGELGERRNTRPHQGVQQQPVPFLFDTYLLWRFQKAQIKNYGLQAKK
uniref:Bm14384 n=1 Tax=Brugia malayi TaxID=6279 RepID=A0A1I9G0R7_BRUMA|nr:Bm14384 [Brugia malayi]